jgi:glyoxylase-like metal-dependent hydrolase (beta-lactamase superfamily II)
VTRTAPAPPSRDAPLLARLLSPPGPARDALVTDGDEGVYAVAGRYCVTYLLFAPGRVAAIDCGSANDLPLIRQALRWLGRGKELRFVLPTHLHFDHVMGVDRLARTFDVPVALGPVAWQHVQTGRPLRFPGRLAALRALPTWPMQGLPLFSAADWRGGLGFGFPWSRNRFRATRQALSGHGEPLPGFPGWTLLETPGHADDALCLHHARTGWLLAGDTVRNFLGGEWNPLQCDAAAYARTRAHLSSLAVRHVFPGHGPIFPTPEGLAALPTRPWWHP